MKADAIRKVTEAFSGRLETALRAVVASDSVFVGPLDDPQVGSAALILFLYRLAPNPSLRNSERRVPSSTPPNVTVFQNALPLDLHYLVTVGSTTAPSEKEGLFKLGLALQAIQSAPNLTGPDVENETVRITVEPLTTEEAGRIWSLFPAANYRTSIAFVASPVWIDPPPPEDAPAPVSDDALIAGRKEAEVGV